MTRIKEQAEKYADRFLKMGSDAIIHVFEYTPDSELIIKVFTAYDEEWLVFVCSCRRNSEEYKRYDIIEGGVANDKVYRTVDLYMSGIYTQEQALEKLIYEMPNNQLCFITQDAMDKCLKFVEHNNIKHG